MSLGQVVERTGSPLARPGGSGPRPGRRRLTLSRLDVAVSPYLYVAPFFLLFAAFGLFPILYTAFVSLHRWDIIGSRTWIGLQNYRDLLADPRFWIALRNTFSIWVLSTVPQLALALFLAHVLDRRFLRAKTFFRMALLVPNVTSVVAVAIVFTSIFGLHFGLVNYVLESLGLGRIDWKAGVLSSHLAISAMVMWRWTGYNALIYLAALQSIPQELYEAAVIDGASHFQLLRRVTVPMLRPAILFTVVVSTIGGLQIFAEPLVFDGGQYAYRGGTGRQYSTLALFLYEQGFRSFKFGYAAAVAWVLFVLISVMVVLNVLVFRRIRSAD